METSFQTWCGGRVVKEVSQPKLKFFSMFWFFSFLSGRHRQHTEGRAMLTWRAIHCRPQSSSLLRMTDSEKSSGELGGKVCSDWFMIESKKNVSDWSIYCAQHKMNVTAEKINSTSTKHRKSYAIGSSELVVAAILICPTYMIQQICLEKQPKGKMFSRNWKK